MACVTSKPMQRLSTQPQHADVTYNMPLYVTTSLIRVFVFVIVSLFCPFCTNVLNDRARAHRRPKRTALPATMSSRRAKDVLAEMKAKDAKVRNRRSRAKAGAVVLSHLNRPVLSKKSKARRRSANRPAASTKRVVVPSFLREATGRKFVGGRVNDASRAAEKKPMGSSQGKREETASDPSGTTYVSPPCPCQSIVYCEYFGLL